MISRMDEYLIHQTEATIDHVASTDVDWQDRFYFNFFDRAGTFAATLGYGVFPNRNTGDGFFRAVFEDSLYAANFSRVLDHDREIVRAGALAIDVVEPMEKWRLALHDQDVAIDLDLDFIARGAPYEFKPIFHRRNERVMWNQFHYTQAGNYRGAVTVAGKTISDLFGVRDRSWGLRNMEQIDLWIWISANFGGLWLTAWHAEYADGKVMCSDGALCPDGSDEKRPVVLTQHDFVFDGERRIPVAARYLLIDETGRTVEVQAKTVGTVFHPFTPGVHDLSDPAQRQALDETAVIFGLVQEYRIGDQVGHGITECLVVGGSEKYPHHWKPTPSSHVTSGTDRGR
jgi:hypothetical protein